MDEFDEIVRKIFDNAKPSGFNIKYESVRKIIFEKEDINIDLLLDEYNDYKSLYETFGDQKYATRMTEIINELNDIN